MGPVCTVMDLLGHPYTRGREVIVDMEDEEMGSIPMHNIVPKLSRSPGAMRRPAPKVGEHTNEILEELKRKKR